MFDVVLTYRVERGEHGPQSIVRPEDGETWELSKTRPGNWLEKAELGKTHLLTCCLRAWGAGVYLAAHRNPIGVVFDWPLRAKIDKTVL